MADEDGAHWRLRTRERLAALLSPVPPTAPSALSRVASRVPELYGGTTTRDVAMDEEALPSLFLATLVILLLLLAGLVWVAFCMAVHRTATRTAMFKRQRRQQTIIAAAITRAVSEGARTADAALASNTSFAYFSQRHARRLASQLPSYEEALSMEAAPPGISIIGGAPPRPSEWGSSEAPVQRNFSSTAPSPSEGANGSTASVSVRSTEPPAYVSSSPVSPSSTSTTTQPKPQKVVRMAPHRPGNSSTQQPPSYAAACHGVARPRTADAASRIEYDDTNSSHI